MVHIENNLNYRKRRNQFHGSGFLWRKLPTLEIKDLAHKTISLITAWYYLTVFMSATNNVFRSKLQKVGHKMYVGESKIIRTISTCFAAGYTAGWS